MQLHKACAAMAALLTTTVATIPARANPRRLILEPASVVLVARGYGLGLVAIDGSFTRFHGILTLDDQDPSVCDLSLEADAGSIALPSAWMTPIALGPEVMDAARYPTFTIAGHCAGSRLQATLTLHGTTRPLALAVTSKPGEWVVAGRLRRAEWGMDARPWLAGPEVSLTITAGLPAGFKTAS